MNKSRIRWFVGLSMTVVAASALLGCDGGGNDDTPTTATPPMTTSAIAPLATQAGQMAYLFYGNTNHKKLGSIMNVRVFDPANPATVLTSSDDIMAATTGRPQPSTTVVGYNSVDGSYSDLYLDTLYYVKGGSPKRASLKIVHDDATHTDSIPTESPHSNATGLTAPAYTEINYLGTKRFLIATDASSQKVIVFPAADGTNIPVPFVNKTLLAVQYTAYGQAASGIVLYNSSSYKFQTMTPPKSGCSACGVDAVDAQYTDFTGVTLSSSSKYKFLGDIGGTATSALVIDGKLYIMDKATLTITEKPVTATDAALNKTLSTTETGLTLNGDSAYFLRTASSIATLYRLNVKTGVLTQVTKDHGASGTTPTKFMSFTSDWVLYGTDGLILAARKSAEKVSPTLLAENTKTSGIRYPFNFGIGSDYLYVTYSVNATTGVTTYKSCLFNASGVSTCKDNSFWAAVSAARKGKLNFSSGYLYTPYAYVRIDDTDNFGGGTIKVVDPAKPLDDGFAVGKIATYNFNTFMHGYYYLNTTVDTNGYIVIYGKRDDNFVGDAFLLNLLKADSVKNLTNESAPSVAEINSGDLHCHGRFCSVCHNFAGGKIYGDAAGSVEAVGYNMKLEFADGTSKLARLGKGKGENFSLLHSDIKGEFTPVIVTADGLNNEIKRGGKLGHSGLSYANCDYCHSKTVLLYGAPAVINIVK